jgi:mevalonate kinase
MKTVVSVPGKINLMGEHAIVHGKPALLSAVNLRMRVTVEDLIREDGSRKTEDRLIIKCAEPDNYVRKICDLVFQKYGITDIPPLKITLDSDIPPGYHLGSSAATAAGVAGALIYHIKKLWNPVAINQLAYEAEKIIHGNPSGGDNTAVTSGGMIWFRKELEFLKSIWQLPVKFPQNLNNLYLFDTGRPAESTGEVVLYIGTQYRIHHNRYQKIFDNNETETKNMAIAIKNTDEKEFMSSIRKGEKTLEQMGAVSLKAKKIIREIEKSGGAAKILGGGGRKSGVGYLLCYLPESIYPGINKKYGDKIRKVNLGEEGIRLEQKE